MKIQLSKHDLEMLFSDSEIFKSFMKMQEQIAITFNNVHIELAPEITRTCKDCSHYIESDAYCTANGDIKASDDTCGKFEVCE